MAGFGIFRETRWNQTIPDEFRGRLAGVELLSYGIGPPAGQLRSGVVASLAGPRVSLVSGGLLCAGAVAVVAARLPGFIRSGKGRAEKEGAQRRRVPLGTGPVGS